MFGGLVNYYKSKKQDLNSELKQENVIFSSELLTTQPNDTN